MKQYTNNHRETIEKYRAAGEWEFMGNEFYTNDGYFWLVAGWIFEKGIYLIIFTTLSLVKLVIFGSKWLYQKIKS